MARPDDSPRGEPDRERADEGSRRSEALLAEAQHLAHIGSWRWDIRTGRLDWSDELYRVFGLDPGRQSPTHELWAACLHPADRERVGDLVVAACRGTRTYDCEYRIVRPDGQARVLHARGRVIRDEAGEAVEMIGMAQDVTDRNRVEEALRESEERFRTLAENVPSLVWTCTAEKQCDYVNPQFTSYTGLPEESLLGAWHLDLIHPDDHAGIFAAWERGTVEAIPIEFELRMRRHDGAWRWFQGRAVPLRDAQGRVVRWFGANTDIDDRKRAEEQLRDLSRRLIRAQEEERRHLARELHDEIGQALTAIQMNVRAALSDPASPAAIRRLEESIALVNRTVEQVRDISLNLHPSLLDELGLVPALRWSVSGFVQRSGIQAQFMAEEGIGRMERDVETACYRIAQEALTNVARYAGARQVRVELSRPGPELRLVVSDDGSGFDVEAATARALGGSSLGVLGMRERARLVGGRVEIASGPGRGTVVRATFPLGGSRPLTGGPADH